MKDPTLPVEAITVVTGGPVGSATFTYSMNGQFQSAAKPIRPVVDIAGNLRLMFYGTFNAGDVYTFQASMGPEVKIADKNVPNIYVQYDYMDWDAWTSISGVETFGNACTVDSECDMGGWQLNSTCHAGFCSHNHFPGDPLYRKVVDQFAKHGITLYIDPVHRAVPHARVITWSQVGDASSPPGAKAACAGADVWPHTEVVEYEMGNGRARRGDDAAGETELRRPRCCSA